MNKDIMKGKWKQFAGTIKQKWGKLTDDDVNYVEGSAEKLVGKLQERYGWDKDRAQKEYEKALKAADEVQD